MPVLAVNKKAGLSYELLETHEAGLVLLGCEVKSIKAGHAGLKESYISLIKSEFFLVKAHVPMFGPAAGSIPDYEPTRPRKLLLKKKEVEYFTGKVAEAGLTLIPLKVYTKDGFLKLEFALGKGLKKHDKREVIKNRDIDRQIKILTKRKLGDARLRQ